MLIVSGNFIDNVVVLAAQSSREYEEAKEEFYKALDKLQRKEISEVEAAANHMESIGILSAYRNGFHDGMRFILNAMAGKEVFDYGEE